MIGDYIIANNRDYGYVIVMNNNTKEVLNKLTDHDNFFQI